MRIQRVFREVLEDDSLQLSPDDSEATLPAWDSFAQVKVIIGLEEEFGVKFSIDEVAETKRVEGLRELIAQKTSGSGAGGA
jgi:acyl carrier protein